MNYQVEDVREMYREMEPLLYDHWIEIAGHKEIRQLKVDWPKYFKLYNAGTVRLFTARDGHKLIGYCATFVQPHLHYSDSVYAMNDVFYIDPDYRGGTCGYRLLKGAIEDLRKHTGAEILCIHMKVEYPFRKLLAKLGFKLTEENWEVVL